jgi:hypothetical protein
MGFTTRDKARATDPKYKPLCSRCQMAPPGIRRPNCAGCQRTRERLNECRAYMARKGMLRCG